MGKLLEITNLSIKFPELNFTAVYDSNFSIYESEILALVGESGSGKSLTALSILGLEPQNSSIKGQINLKENSLLKEEAFINSDSRTYPKSIRGNLISYIPQDPLSSLNPMYTIFNQLNEAITVCFSNLSKEERYKRSLEALANVGIPDPARALKAYPHELSGGMRQRVMIAMAIINNPDLIIADEPTTALDVTVQANILELLKSLGKTILFITHDLGVVAEIADRVLVMERGKIVEQADVFKIFEDPQEQYTKDLLAAVPRL
jgi:peptide/nickel transport system ATP-binding protein